MSEVEGLRTEVHVKEFVLDLYDKGFNWDDKEELNSKINEKMKIHPTVEVWLTCAELLIFEDSESMIGKLILLNLRNQQLVNPQMI
ncbi:hypothetical protein ACWEWU_14685 [Staphylococcus xylosus]